MGRSCLSPKPLPTVAVTMLLHGQLPGNMKLAVRTVMLHLPAHAACLPSTRLQILCLTNPATLEEGRQSR
jgi:hypothetical protein